jgi:hypothetical protein
MIPLIVLLVLLVIGFVIILIVGYLLVFAVITSGASFLLGLAGCITWRLLAPPAMPEVWYGATIAVLTLAVVVDRLRRRQRLRVLHDQRQAIQDEFDAEQDAWQRQQSAREQRGFAGALQAAGTALEQPSTGRDQVAAAAVRASGVALRAGGGIPVVRETALIVGGAAVAAAAGPPVVGKGLRKLGKIVAGQEPRTARHQELVEYDEKFAEEISDLEAHSGCAIFLGIILLILALVFWPWPQPAAPGTPPTASPEH